MGLKISPEFGLNPSISTCFWCGEAKGIALFGAAYKENGKQAEAPRNLVLDYQPCTTCSNQWSEGTAIIEVVDKPTNNQPPISNQDGKDHYPTGRVVVVSTEWVLSNFEVDHKEILVSSKNFEQLLSVIHTNH